MEHLAISLVWPTDRPHGILLTAWSLVSYVYPAADRAFEFTRLESETDYKDLEAPRGINGISGS